GGGAARQKVREGGGRLHGGADGDCDIGDNRVRLETDQLSSQRGQAVDPPELVPPVDHEILSLDVAKVPKPLTEGLRWGRVGRIEGHQYPDARQLSRLLLRLARDRGQNETDSENDREPDPPHRHLARDGWRGV